MKRKPIRIKEDPVAKLRSKFKKMRLSLTDLKLAVDMIDEKVNESVAKSMSKRIIKIIEDKVYERTEMLKAIISKELISEHGEYIERNSNMKIEEAVRNGIRFKILSLQGDKISLEKIDELYEKGWRVAYFGPLSDKTKSVMLFDRPISISEEMKRKPKRVVRSKKDEVRLKP